MPRGNTRLPRLIALGFSAVCLRLSIAVLIGMDRHSSEMQFLERRTGSVPPSPTSSSSTSSASMASAPLVALTTFLTLLAVLISWDIDLRPKEYFAWMLLLEAG